jgi:hypothetical protein
MSDKIKKYIEFLKNPNKYINNEKYICEAVNALISKIDTIMDSVDESIKDLINSNFPQIKQINCGNNIASLLGNTQFTNTSDLVKKLIAKYLYICNLLEIDQDTEKEEPKKNCDNIKDIIDKAIVNMDINQLLSTNIFSDKPIKYKEDTVNINQNLVSNFKKDLIPTLVFTDRDLEIVKGRSILTTELFDQKKKFADEVTKLMSSKFIFNDENQDIINNFQYLINKMFNDKISEYIKIKNYADDAILFVYKGGTTMKIIYDKYKSLFTTALNKKLFDNNVKYFSRSDADYGIFINKAYFKTFDAYNEILCDMNKISFNILSQVQGILSNNLDCLCPLNNVSENNLITLLNNFNNILNAPDRQKSLPDFKDIDKIIGITFNNKDYFTEQIPIGLSDTRIHDLQTKSGDYIDDDIIDTSYISKREQIIKYGKIGSNRDNFIIKIHENNTVGQPRFNSAIYNLSKITNTNPHGIYYYLNETNKFVGSDITSILTEFNLHRLKINAILYYITKDGKYGYFNCPCELVDVSISGFYDGKIKGIKLNETIKKYKNKKVEFNSYTLYGFIDDLFKALYYETKYPWIADKYEKKVYRLMILLLIYINNKYTNTKLLYDELSKFINELFNNNFIDISLFIIYDKKTGEQKYIKDDILIYKLYNNILKLYNTIQKETDPVIKQEDMAKFRDMKKIYDELLKSFTPEDIHSGYDANIEEVPFLEKYLKYKNKYLSLQKKLRHK